jgi:hypothetical protein
MLTVMMMNSLHDPAFELHNPANAMLRPRFLRLG